MAKIQVFQGQRGFSTTSPQSGMAKASFKAKDFGDGDGVRKLGNAAVKMQESADQKTKIEIQGKLAKAELNLLGETQELQRNAPLGAKGHVNGVKSLVAQTRNNILSQYPERFHQTITNSFASTELNNVRGAMNFEAESTAKKTITDYAETGDTLQETAQVTPGLEWTLLRSAENLSKDMEALHPNVSPEVHRDALQEIKQGISFNANNARISQMTEEGQVDKFIEDAGKEGSVIRENLDTDNFAKVIKYAEARKDQIGVERRQGQADAAKKSNVDFAIRHERVLTAAEGGDSNAQAQIASGQFVIEAEQIAEDTGSLTALKSASTQQRSQLRKDQKNIATDATTAFDFKVVEDRQDALDGKLTRVQLAAQLDSGAYEGEPAAYEKVLNAITLRERRDAAVEAGSLADARKFNKDMNKLVADIKQDRTNLENTDIVHRLRYGLIPQDKVQEMISSLEGTKFFTKADAANRRYQKTDKTEREQKQKELVRLEAEQIEAKLLKGASTLDLVEEIDSFEARNGHTSQGQGLANALRAKITPDLVKRARVAAAASAITQSLADPKNKTPFSQTMDPNEKEAFNSAATFMFEAYSEQLLQDGVAPEDAVSKMRDFKARFVRSTNVIPKVLSDGIINNLASNDPTKVTSAAIDMQRYVNINPVFAQQFKSQFAFGNEINRLISVGYSSEDAYNNVINLRDAHKQVTNERKKSSYNAQVKENGNSNVDFMETKINDDNDWDEKVFGQAVQSPSFMAAFDLLAETEYLLGDGKLKDARNTAFVKMKANWGISGINGTATFVRNPPELHYGLPALGREGNTEWITNQFREEASKWTTNDGSQKYELEGRRVEIRQHPSRMNNGKPTYQVFYEDDTGAIFHIPEMDGAFPDWNDSKEARDMVNKQQMEALTERAKTKAETIEAAKNRGKEFSLGPQNKSMLGMGMLMKDMLRGAKNANEEEAKSQPIDPMIKGRVDE